MHQSLRIQTSNSLMPIVVTRRVHVFVAVAIVAVLLLLTHGVNGEAFFSLKTESTPAPFGARTTAMSAMCDGELYIHGGQGSSTVYSDTWIMSTSGAWRNTSNTPNPSTGPIRTEGAATTIANSLILLTGGSTGTGWQNDVYSLTCGTSVASPQWTRITSSAPWQSRTGHGMVSFNGQIVLFGGSHSAHLNDVWTLDATNVTGAPWVKQTSANWIGRTAFTASIFNNSIFMTGGFVNGQNLPSTETWYLRSLDQPWVQLTTPAFTPGRAYHVAQPGANQLWMTTGTSGQSVLDDLWYLNGTTWVWTLAAADNGATARQRARMEVMGDRLILLTGSGIGVTGNDVWQSLAVPAGGLTGGAGPNPPGPTTSTGSGNPTTSTGTQGSTGGDEPDHGAANARHMGNMEVAIIALVMALVYAGTQN